VAKWVGLGHLVATKPDRGKRRIIRDAQSWPAMRSPVGGTVRTLDNGWSRVRPWWRRPDLEREPVHAERPLGVPNRCRDDFPPVLYRIAIVRERCEDVLVAVEA